MMEQSGSLSTDGGVASYGIRRSSIVRERTGGNGTPSKLGDFKPDKETGQSNTRQHHAGALSWTGLARVDHEAIERRQDCTSETERQISAREAVAQPTSVSAGRCTTSLHTPAALAPGRLPSSGSSPVLLPRTPCCLDRPCPLPQHQLAPAALVPAWREAKLCRRGGGQEFEGRALLPEACLAGWGKCQGALRTAVHEASSCRRHLLGCS